MSLRESVSRNSLCIDVLDRKREKAKLWYNYYFCYRRSFNKKLINSCPWNTVLTQCMPVRRLGNDMDRGDSDPKDLDMALVCFVMNDNKFPTNLERRVHRQLNGQVVENDSHSKGSNQWGIDLYNELQWLDVEDKQHDFVLLRNYVKPMGARGPRPTDEEDDSDSGGDNDAASRSKQVRSKAQSGSSTSELEDSLANEDEDEHDDEVIDPRNDHGENYNGDDDEADVTYLRPSIQPKIPLPATAVPEREPHLLTPSTHAVITASELSSTRDTQKQQQQHGQAHRLVVRPHGLGKYRSDAGRATASPSPHSVENAYEEAVHDKNTTKRMRSLQEDSQGPDEPMAKRSRVSSAPAQRSTEEGDIAGAFHLPPVITTERSGKDQTSRPDQRSRRPGPSSLPLPPMRRPATLADPEAPAQQLDQLPSKSRSQFDFNGTADGADGSAFVDRFQDHMLRLHSNDGSQRGMNGKHQDHLVRDDTHRTGHNVCAETAGDGLIHDDDQGDLTTVQYARGEQIGASEETKPVSEKVLDERLSTHMRDLEVQIQLSVASMEDNLIRNMMRGLDVIKTATMALGGPVIKPGSKLPNGVVVWDVRLLTTVWNPEDFGDFFSVVEEQRWHEDDRAWMLQEKYFTELALAHSCGPKSLARLARSWQLTDLRVDLEKDLSVVLAQKVYIRTVAGTFDKDQMEGFFKSINEG